MLLPIRKTAHRNITERVLAGYISSMHSYSIRIETETSQKQPKDTQSVVIGSLSAILDDFDSETAI